MQVIAIRRRSLPMLLYLSGKGNEYLSFFLIEIGCNERLLSVMATCDNAGAGDVIVTSPAPALSLSGSVGHATLPGRMRYAPTAHRRLAPGAWQLVKYWRWDSNPQVTGF